MPSIHTIPQRLEKRCEPCQYHKRASAFYGSDHSWHEYKCTHPNALDELALPEDPVRRNTILVMRARVDGLLGLGRHIGRTEKQPDWCPLNRTETK